MVVVQSERRGALTALFLGIGCFAGAAPGCSGASPHTGEPAPAPTHIAHSNVARDDYVGSLACEPCHADIVTSWKDSPMHRMTRDARGADVHAPFDGARFRFKDDSVVLETRGADRTMRIETPSASSVTYRVTRIIGGRIREDFAGVDVDRGGDEVILPVSYMIGAGRFRYKGYSVLVHERDHLRAGPSWSRACVFCHNTIPELDRLLGAVAGPKARPYQGEQVDRWLLPERRQSAHVRDPTGFAHDVGDELTWLRSPLPGGLDRPRDISRAAIEAVRSSFDGRALVEVGIGCEACHGGAREHSQNPGVRPSLMPVANWLAPSENASRASSINHLCARCHQVLFSRYPFTWEGGRRDAMAGGSPINSGEGRDLLLGGCAMALACTDCHDPHGARATRPLLETPAGNRVCTRCHSSLGDPNAVRTHTHHSPSGVAGLCVSCHLPRKNMGLDGTLTRYHRIGSPTDAARVLGDRPLECAICHEDKSVANLVDTMEAWWPVRYPREQLRELYGSLDANVLRATLARGKPHEQAVAMATLGRAHATDATEAIAARLVSEYPLIREWAKRALVALRGPCEIDLDADAKTIGRQGQMCSGAPLVAPSPSPSFSDEDPED